MQLQDTFSVVFIKGKSHKDKLPRARKSHNTVLAKTEDCGRRVR